MIQQPDAPRQFDLCTGRDIGDFELKTHSCIIKCIFPIVYFAEFTRHVASRRGAFIGAVDIYVRAFFARRRRDAEAVGGADEAEGEGEGEARHLLACDRVSVVLSTLSLRASRASDAISSGKTTQSKRSCERRVYAEHAMCRRQDDLKAFLSCGRRRRT